MPMGAVAAEFTTIWREGTMDENKVTDSLRDISRAMNGEARFCGPATLERCMSNVLDGPGVDWLLDTAQALGLSNAEQVRQNAPAYRELLCSQAGKQGLKTYVAQHREEIERLRRLMVALGKAGGGRRQPLKFSCEESADAGQVYGVLTQNWRE